MPWTFWFYARADRRGSAELLLDKRGLESAIVSKMRTDMELHLLYSVSSHLLFKHAFYSSCYRSIPTPDCQAFCWAIPVVPAAIVGRGDLTLTLNWITMIRIRGVSA